MKTVRGPATVRGGVFVDGVHFRYEKRQGTLAALAGQLLQDFSSGANPALD
jgi:hypothetical protein